jgi:hypothetical protein
MFGAAVQLVGADAPSLLIAPPGRALTVTLIWQPLATEGESLVRFIQILNADGQLVAQQDAVPCHGECPSTSWLPGEYLRDDGTIPIPATLPAGIYRLITGWYSSATLQRLAVLDADNQSVPTQAIELPIVIQVR